MTVAHALVLFLGLALILSGKVYLTYRMFDGEDDSKPATADWVDFLATGGAVGGFFALLGALIRWPISLVLFLAGLGVIAGGFWLLSAA